MQDEKVADVAARFAAWVPPAGEEVKGEPDGVFVDKYKVGLKKLTSLPASTSHLCSKEPLQNIIGVWDPK